MNQFIANHIIVIPAVAACVAAVGARIDSVILLSLRFFSPDTIKSELDRLDALAKARVDKDAAAVKPCGHSLDIFAPSVLVKAD